MIEHVSYHIRWYQPVLVEWIKVGEESNYEEAKK